MSITILELDSTYLIFSLFSELFARQFLLGFLPPSSGCVEAVCLGMTSGGVGREAGVRRVGGVGREAGKLRGGGAEVSGRGGSRVLGA